MKTLRILALSAALVAPLSPMAWAATDTPVESVKVEADITAIKNERAATYWGGVAKDIEAAILARVSDRVAEKGSRITVDIDEISLANSFEASIGAEDSVLKGNVMISSDDNSKYDAYELSISMSAASKFLPEGSVAIVSMTDAPEHYRAMIDAFASNVVERLK
ncbi:hypothetical protein [Gemmobacter serpentinus]|uniref:hypothetical protein n=1 Tax=Gemmobacter serpentinus TaxID=2652247 RepID=UPI00124F43C8|nr:hypothetical protein [Gemmobacter serpentinus]